MVLKKSLAEVIVLVILCIFSASTVLAEEVSEIYPYRPQNIALMEHGGSARASSSSGDKWGAEKAYDGQSWHFQVWWPQPSQQTPQWIERKLDKPYLIGRVITRTVLAPDKCSFKIELSLDGNSWQKVALYDNVREEVVAEFPPVMAQFIRTTFSSDNTPIYEQMIYEAVPRGKWGGEAGVTRIDYSGETVLLWSQETVAICSEPFEVFVAAEEHGFAKPDSNLYISGTDIKVSAKNLGDGTRFLVTGIKPGKKTVNLMSKKGDNPTKIAQFEVEFLPSFDDTKMTPFFPLGVYWGTQPWPIGSEAFRKTTKRDFPLIKQLGANCVVPGLFTPQDGPVKEYLTILDVAEENNLKLILPVWALWVSITQGHDITITEIYPPLKQLVDAVSGHPALLGYYAADEPMPWSYKNLHTIERVMRSLDPAHPVIAVFNVPGQMRTLVPGSDLRVNFTDIYPVTYKNPVGDIRAENVFERGDKVEFGDLMENLRSMASSKPFWFVPQAYGATKSEGSRLPEPVELRLMCWLALSRGMTGIVPYVFDTSMEKKELISILGDKNVPTPLYEEVKNIFGTMGSLSSTLLKLKYPEKPFSVFEPAEAKRFKGTDAREYIVVVNRDVKNYAEIRLDITLQGIKSNKGVCNVKNGTYLQEDQKQKGLYYLHLEPGDGTVLRID